MPDSACSLPRPRADVPINDDRHGPDGIQSRETPAGDGGCRGLLGRRRVSAAAGTSVLGRRRVSAAAAADVPGPARPSTGPGVGGGPGRGRLGPRRVSAAGVGGGRGPRP